MPSFTFTLNSSLSDGDLEAEVESENNKDDGLVEPGPGEDSADKTPKKPPRKELADDDVLDSADHSEPEVVDNSYIKDFSDGNRE